MPPQYDLRAALDSPWVAVVLGTLGVGLLLVLARELRRIPRVLLVLMATAFVDMVGVLILVPLIPFYVKQLYGGGLTVLGHQLEVGTLSGIVASTYIVAQLLTAPLWGRFSDRYGRRPALLVALSASALGYLVFACADSLWLILLSRAVQGAGGGTVGVIHAYVSDSTAPNDRARALGWLSAATNLGVFLGPVLGSLAIALGKRDLWPGDGALRLGGAAPGLAAALLCIVNIAFAARHLRESRARPEPSAKPAAGPVATAELAPRGAIVRLIAIYAVCIGAWQGLGTSIALFLDHRFGIDETRIGLFYAFLGGVSVYARALLLGRMLDRFGEARLSRLGVLLLAMGLLLLPQTTSLPALALATLLVPLGTAFTFPCVTALLSRAIASADRGFYLGLQQGCGGVSRALLPLVYGPLFDHVARASPFYAAAGLVLLTLPLGFGFDRFARSGH